MSAERHPGLVSTIIPVYNRGEMMRESVASVLAQTWPRLEVVIVDDGSTDDTLAVAEALAAEHPGKIRVLSQANAGPGPARQAGLEAASGEFIQFLDSDDLLDPRKFEVQLRALSADVEAGIAYCCSHLEASGGRRSLFPDPGATAPRTLFPALLARRLWSTGAPLYRREVCAAIGPWSSKRVLEDWDYDCRAGVLGVKLSFQPEGLVIKRRHEGEHAGRAWHSNPAAMQDRIRAYEDAAEYARVAGVAADAGERQQFARSLFWMARICDQAGLTDAASRLLRLARSQSLHGANQIRFYQVARALLGGRLAARLGGRYRQVVANDGG